MVGSLKIEVKFPCGYEMKASGWAMFSDMDLPVPDTCPVHGKKCNTYPEFDEILRLMDKKVKKKGKKK